MVRIVEKSSGVQQGMRFGQWLVIGKPFSSGANYRFNVVAQCDCGRVCVVGCISIGKNSFKCKSCQVRNHRTTHGHSARNHWSRLYRIWQNMKNRCFKENIPLYERYGARGIRVCDEWIATFEPLRDWALANGYSDSLTIDRIDNAGNYCPENCRWVDCTVQAQNTRRNVYLTVFGETKCISEWARDERCTVASATLLARINRGWEQSLAVSLPLQKSRLGSPLGSSRSEPESTPPEMPPCKRRDARRRH